MFVRASTHEALKKKFLQVSLDYGVLRSKWNDLVRRINAKGGERFLAGECKQLSSSEIKKLLMLCHPDKHGGMKMAEEMTIRLLALRDEDRITKQL